jgi:diaminopimelate epimerase
MEELGRWLTAHPELAHGANVQLAQPAGPRRLHALVWERGVGPTEASGTSACAVAVAAVHRGDVEPGPVEVAMAGGTLQVQVEADLEVTLRGPVEEVMTGRLCSGFLESLPDR